MGLPSTAAVREMSAAARPEQCGSGGDSLMPGQADEDWLRQGGVQQFGQVSQRQHAGAVGPGAAVHWAAAGIVGPRAVPGLAKNVALLAKSDLANKSATRTPEAQPATSGSPS